AGDARCRRGCRSRGPGCRGAMTSGKPQLELVRDTTASLAEAESPLRRRVIVFVSVCAAIAVGFSLWTRYRVDPIARLPAEERRTLYVKTLEHFSQICEAAELGPEVRPLCADEADLLLRFPDCGSECHDRVADFAHAHPTR